MGLSVNTNTSALNAYRNLSTTNNQMAKSLEKLSSGFRINRAADDAAGLAISEGLRSQIGGIKVAVRNTQDGISVVQTAEGGLSETTSILQRMRDLAVQAANEGGNDANSNAAMDSEGDALKLELTRIADKTTFNNVKLLDGSYNKTFQVGYASGDTTAVKISATSGSTSFSSTGLAVDSIDLTTAAGASAAIGAIDTAIKNVSTARANLGAIQNRFEHTINNLNTTAENLTASESRIRDTDMAQEMTNFTRTQILTQAGTSMLAQANQSTQGILKLLG
ncbi:flagellin [Modestobacter sp. L9-4]|jgi:flagellin|uniref:flagellin N-terminal helical domain-containing protein n=1 Tax=Modestobacter sp. L9-4 TaxID=2851567 RepID=UPI001C75F5A9|nr:flagellin [Modestobacter sp. L9-4]QXG75057.1 flagellin [Modestobacter sp. L9-4]